MEHELHAGHVEIAVAQLIGYRSHIIVPNVSYGWGLRHEADLIAVDENWKATEIEIKVTLADLKADFNKQHNHSSPKIGRLVYAVPRTFLDKAVEIIPKQYGIIVVQLVKFGQYHGLEAVWARNVRHRKDYKGISQKDLLELTRLGCMRIWSLKQSKNTLVRYREKLCKP